MKKLLTAGLVCLASVGGAITVTSQEAMHPPQPAQLSERHEINIPEDLPIPPLGKRVVVPLSSGMVIRLAEGAVYQSSFEGKSLALQFSGHGTIVLEGLLEQYAEPVELYFGRRKYPLEAEQDVNREAIEQVLAALEKGEDLGDVLEATAAGGGAGGGGELFGIIQVAGWFIDQLDFTAQAHAQDVAQASATTRNSDVAIASGSGVLPALLAQMQIASAELIKICAEDYLVVAKELHNKIRERTGSGVSQGVDLEVAHALVLQATLEVKEATFNLDLAIDEHQDLYGERLMTSVLPQLPFSLDDSLAATLRRLHVDQKPLARRYWRQAQFSQETLALLDQLQLSVDKTRLAYRDQFDLGQRSLSDYISAINAYYQVSVRQVRRAHDLHVAEAWLLDAERKLKKGILLHPGWQ